MIAIMAAAPAYAEDATGDEHDIVVTAQKREQRLIDVPQSVSVVSGEAQCTRFLAGPRPKGDPLGPWLKETRP